VVRADCNPLGSVELDSQGRCVMTDHGRWVCFNVYVPCGGGASTLPNKMKFLNALREAMGRQRTLGKSVVLVGDMNLKLDKRDVFWRQRVVNIDDVLETEGVEGDDEEEGRRRRRWLLDVKKNWSRITSALETIEAIPRQTTNPSTKETFDRYRARVKAADGKFVMLGSFEDTPEEALYHYNFEEQSYVDSESEEQQPILYQKKNVISIDVLAEIMSKIAHVTWDEGTLRSIAEWEGAGLNVDATPYLWGRGLLEEDGMVDVFRHLYPEAEGR
jgi:hypothetical protein